MWAVQRPGSDRRREGQAQGQGAAELAGLRSRPGRPEQHLPVRDRDGQRRDGQVPQGARDAALQRPLRPFDGRVHREAHRNPEVLGARTATDDSKEH